MDQVETGESGDLVRRPMGFVVLWGLPLFILLAIGVFDLLTATFELLVAVAAFAWMGVGCVVNAARCGRLHCYVAGPILLTGALLMLVRGLDLAALGGVTVTQISYAAGALALASCLLERVWGPYVRRLPT